MLNVRWEISIDRHYQYHSGVDLPAVRLHGLILNEKKVKAEVLEEKNRIMF